MAFGQPMFVSEIRPETNEVVLGTEDELVRNGMTVAQVNSMKYASIAEGKEALTKVRYRDNGAMASLHPIDEDKLFVNFHANVKGIAPGQSAVFYEGDDVIGGGVIYSSSNI